ncbi:hypothetical protein D3C77_529620 [compost metagenome]
MHGGVHAARGQFQIRVVDVGKQLELGVRHLGLQEINGGGAGLDGNGLAGEGLGVFDIGVLVADQNGQAAFIVGIREVDDLLAVVSNRDAGQCGVDVLRLQARNDAVEVHRLKLVLQVEFLGDGGPEIHIKAHIGITLLELERHESGIGGHHQFLALGLGAGHGAEHGHGQADQGGGDFTFDHETLLLGTVGSPGCCRGMIPGCAGISGAAYRRS